MVGAGEDNGMVKFYSYVPNNDTDGDGVANTLGRIPARMSAASVDTDHDGYPRCVERRQQPGRQYDRADARCLPAGLACWLPAHGSGGVCNYGATVPNYIPDQVVQQGNVVYLLSSANKRVYRWSISGGCLSQSLRGGYRPGVQHRGADHDRSTRPPTSVSTSAMPRGSSAIST